MRNTLQRPAASGRIPIPLGLAVLFLVVQDTLASILNIQAIATIAILLLYLLLWLGNFGSTPSSLSPYGAPLLLGAFIVWAIFVGIMVGFNADVGIQNLSVWMIFYLAVSVTYARSTPGTYERIYPWWRRASYFIAVVYILQSLIFGGFGAAGYPYSNRGAGWALLIAAVMILPRVVLIGESWVPLFLLSIGILLSESRTPIAAMAVLMIVALSLRPHRDVSPSSIRILARLVLYSIVAIVVVLTIVIALPPIRDRFLSGDSDLTLGSLSINTSGRSVLWDLILEDTQKDWLLGQGPGHAQSFITAYFGGWIAHPHNEYLRILNDVGVVGLALWVGAWLALLIRFVRASARALSPETQALHISAVLALAVLAIGSVTDNVTTALFHMAIYGAVFGLSSSYARSDSSRPRSHLLRHREYLPANRGRSTSK